MTEPLLERLLNEGRRATQVQDLLDKRFGTGVAVIDEVLKGGADSLVMAGTFRDAPSVFKLFLGENATQIVPKMQAELSWLDAQLGQGRYRVNRLLEAVSQDGLVILERVEGDRVSLCLKSGDAQMRQQALRLCSGWLSAVAPLRMEYKRLGRTRLERQFDSLDLTGLPRSETELTNALIKAARRFGKQVRGMNALHTVAHGDFAPVNMLSDGQNVWAVDIQGPTRFPLARIVARFLVAKDMYSSRPGVRRWGLDADDLTLFLADDLLPPEEAQTTLPFFIAQQMVRRFVTTYAQRGANPAAVSRLTDCLKDLEAA